MSACLSEKTVWEYVTGHVVADDRQSIEAHLSACPTSRSQRRLARLRWSEDHPFRWLGAAENPEDPTHAEACYRLGVLAEQDVSWHLGRQWHQRAIDAGPSKWADEAQRRLAGMPDRIKYLWSTTTKQAAQTPTSGRLYTRG